MFIFCLILYIRVYYFSVWTYTKKWENLSIINRTRKIVCVLICVALFVSPVSSVAFAAGADFVSFYPANAATDVPTVTNLQIEFENQPFPVEAKYITIKKVSDNSTVETIQATDDKVTIIGNTVTIDPTDYFDQNTQYYVEMDAGAFTVEIDRVIYESAVISGSATWAFTTAEWTSVSFDEISGRLDGGNNHSVGINSDGSVSAWGDNTYGQTTVPGGISDALSVSAGNNFAAAVNSDGTVSAWGDSTSNQTDVPIGLTDVVKLSSFNNVTIALKNDGTIVSWGDGSGLPYPSHPFSFTFNYGIVDIAAGGWQSYVLYSDGTLGACKPTSRQRRWCSAKAIRHMRCRSELAASGSCRFPLGWKLREHHRMQPFQLNRNRRCLRSTGGRTLSQ